MLTDRAALAATVQQELDEVRAALAFHPSRADHPRGFQTLPCCRPALHCS